MTHGRTHRRLRHDRRLPDRRARLPRRLDRLVLCAAFDSEACFAALLGSPEHGRWSIAPRTKAKITRRYRTDTLVLETQFETADGAATLIDFMPTGLRPLEHRTAGGRHPRSGGYVDRTHSPFWLWRRSALGDTSRRWCDPRHCGTGHGGGAHPGSFARQRHDHGRRVQHRQGRHNSFRAELFAFASPLNAPFDPTRALQDTETFWRDWAAKCRPAGQWSDAVRRSMITLKALTYMPTGGMVAAPTTSLPEQLGGERNWDYRFCWLRDATLVLLGAMNAGYYEEARAWREWLLRAVAGSPEQLQIMYGIAGERRLTEWTAPWLPGYENSAPVRIGNAAYSQLQLDVFGEIMDVHYQARRGGLSGDELGVGRAAEISRASGANLDRSGRGDLGGARRRRATSLTPRSWPGWRSIGRSGARKLSACEDRSINGAQCATKSIGKSAPRGSTGNWTRSCNLSVRRSLMRASCRFPRSGSCRSPIPG